MRRAGGCSQVKEQSLCCLSAGFHWLSMPFCCLFTAFCRGAAARRLLGGGKPDLPVHRLVHEQLRLLRPLGRGRREQRRRRERQVRRGHCSLLCPLCCSPIRPCPSLTRPCPSLWCSPYVNLAISGLVETPGYLAAYVATTLVGQKWACVGGLTGAGTPQHGSSSKKKALITSDYGIMCSMRIKWP